MLFFVFSAFFPFLWIWRLLVKFGKFNIKLIFETLQIKVVIVIIPAWFWMEYWELEVASLLLRCQNIWSIQSLSPRTAGTLKANHWNKLAKKTDFHPMNSPLLMWEWIALDCWFEARPQHCEKIWCAAYLSYNVHNFNVHTINTDSCLNGIRYFFFYAEEVRLCHVVRKLHQPRCCWTGAKLSKSRIGQRSQIFVSCKRKFSGC